MCNIHDTVFFKKKAKISTHSILFTPKTLNFDIAKNTSLKVASFIDNIKSATHINNPLRKFFMTASVISTLYSSKVNVQSYRNCELSPYTCCVSMHVWQNSTVSWLIQLVIITLECFIENHSRFSVFFMNN